MSTKFAVHISWTCLANTVRLSNRQLIASVDTQSHSMFQSNDISYQLSIHLFTSTLGYEPIEFHKHFTITFMFSSWCILISKTDLMAHRNNKTAFYGSFPVVGYLVNPVVDVKGYRVQ